MLSSLFRCGWICLLALASFPACAVSPYVTGYQFPERGVAEVMRAVETRLAAQRFEVVGRHLPPGLPNYGTLIVTDRRLLESIRQIGGTAIVGVGIRVGVRADGATFYMNPEYWYRAYFRRRYDLAQTMVADVQRRLAQALGAGTPFGGDETPLDLADYRYMIGMEKFDSPKNELARYPSFEAAVSVVRANLHRGVGATAKVYEVVMPEQRLAVFGVAMNDPKTGEGWWVKSLGPDHIAALPYEIYVVGNRVGALYGRYRIALGWPALGMGSFMSIRDAPFLIRETLARVAGAAADGR